MMTPQRNPPVQITDEFFSNVVLLLDFAGADAATNITDLSDSAHVDTFVDAAQVDTAIQLLGENTLLLDGDGDFVTFPDSDDWDFGTGDFTVEFHIRFAVLMTQTLIGNYLTGSGTDKGWLIQLQSNMDIRFLQGDTSLLDQAWPNIAQDVDFHVAVTRSGTDLRAFVDGVQTGSTITDSTDFASSVQPLRLGILDGSIQDTDGNIGAVRVTKGVARYTANFTPPTTFYPTVAPPPSLDFADVVLLLDFAGSDGDTNITDLSNSAHDETFFGDAEVDTAVQIISENTLLQGEGGNNGLTYADSDDWDFGTGDFTLEGFINRSTHSTNSSLLSTWKSDNTGWFIRVSSGGTNVSFWTAGVTVINETFSFVTDTTYHIAVCRSGDSILLFVDGVQQGSTLTHTDAINSSADPLVVGALSSGAQSLQGNIGAVRIVKGFAVYTTDFTPPTEFYPTS